MQGKSSCKVVCSTIWYRLFRNICTHDKVGYYQIFPDTCSTKQWLIYQLDMKSTFLHGLEEEIFVKQPKGFVADSSKVYLFKKALWLKASAKSLV